MEMAKDLFEVSLKGPGPYGFRLYGGEGDPFIVAKLRARSKAHDAGLREGDFVLGINGRSCETISHGVAMTLLETADELLRLHLYRGERQSIAAAYGAVGGQLRPVSPGIAAPNRSIFSIQPSTETEIESAHHPPVEVAAPPPPATSEDAGQPGTGGQSTTSYSTQFGEGVTQTVTSETQDLGGVTLTKVTREVTKEHHSGATWSATGESVKVQSATLFHVPSLPRVRAQPLIRWEPETAAAPPAGSGQFHVHTAASVEISGKENFAPNKKRDFGDFAKVSDDPPKFKVHKTTAKRWVWQPGNVPSLPVREPSPAMAFQVLETQNLEQEFSKGRVGGGGEKNDHGREGGDQFGLSPHLIHVLTTEGDPEDFAFSRQRKIFADSSFYDDPEQKYPTIEEQIKMARKVALSLSAPDNVTARGQRMFLKCKQKANEQAVDGDQSPHAPVPTVLPKRTEQQALYYNPTPWNTSQTNKVERVAPGATNDHLEGYPDDPDASSASFAKHKALFEEKKKSRDRDLPWKKTSHKCVGLTKDLTGLKGKGAKMFAQRRATAIEEEAKWQSEGGGREWVAETGERNEERRHDASDSSDPQGAQLLQGASARRLEELIGISRAYLSPWETKTASQTTIQTPWQVTTATASAAEGQQTKTAATSGDFPGFIVKKTNPSAYRPVKFNLPSNGPGAGITDF